MANGVLTIPLAGTSSNASRRAEARAQRPSEFVAGHENALAATALEPFLDGKPNVFCPLVLYGPHGSGKTHLAAGLADWWRGRFADVPVRYFSGTEFARELAAAAADGQLDAWRAELRGVGLLVLDDLSELGNKRPAQQELLHVLDALAERGAVVVITARTLPNHWPVLLAALRGRLSGGLAVPLAFPERAARREILLRLAAARGTVLAPRTLDAMTAGLHGSVPALTSALAELELTASALGRGVDQRWVRQFVARRNGATAPTLRQIAALTAKYFGLRVADLKGPVRRRPLVAGRTVAMYLSRQLTSSSLEQIGSFFGGRDHTTVLYGCRRTKSLMRRDPATRQAVAELQRLLAPASPVVDRLSK